MILFVKDSLMILWLTIKFTFYFSNFIANHKIRELENLCQKNDNNILHYKNQFYKGVVNFTFVINFFFDKKYI